MTGIFDVDPNQPPAVITREALARAWQQLRDAPPPAPLGSDDNPFLLPVSLACSEGGREAIDRALPPAARIRFFPGLPG